MRVPPGLSFVKRAVARARRQSSRTVAITPLPFTAKHIEHGPSPYAARFRPQKDKRPWPA